jgi:hypothetical protein
MGSGFIQYFKSGGFTCSMRICNGIVMGVIIITFFFFSNTFIDRYLRLNYIIRRKRGRFSVLLLFDSYFGFTTFIEIQLQPLCTHRKKKY